MPDIGAFAEPMVGDAGQGTLATGRYAALGVGDPCRYYLGEAYRLPTEQDWLKFLGIGPGITPIGNVGWSYYDYYWYKPSVLNAYFVSSDWRQSTNGAWQDILRYASYATCTPAGNTNQQMQYIDPQGFYYKNSLPRSSGFSVRCTAY